jgi:hypothetical protein
MDESYWVKLTKYSLAPFIDDRGNITNRQEISQYPLYKQLPPAHPELSAKIDEMTRQVSNACNDLMKMGIEPFVEFVYDDDRLVKSVTVRPRRDDDKV